MSSRNIGKIIAIGINGITAEVYDSLGNYISTKDGIRFVGEVGSYISIYDIDRIIIAEVIGVDEKSYFSSETLVKPNSKKQIYLSLLGEISENKFCFGVSRMPLIYSEIHLISEKDLKIMLEVGSEEQRITNTDNKTRMILLPIGKSVVFPEYKVRVNIDKFFGFHFAIFGNTGAGKSNTVALLLQIIFNKNNYSAKGAKFIIIDSNGEYKKAFSEIGMLDKNLKVKSYVADTKIDEEVFEIPVWSLSVDDWAILLHASEKTQIPILKRAIDLAKIFYSKNDNNDSLKNHILASTILGIINSSDSSPSKSDKLLSVLKTFNTREISLESQLNGSIKIKYDLVDGVYTLRKLLETNFGQINDMEAIISFLQTFINPELIASLEKNEEVAYDLNQFVQAVEFAIFYEGSISSQRIHEYTSTLITRLQSINEGVQGSFLKKTEFSTIEDYIDHIIGDNQILNIDISSLDDSSAEVITKVLAKLTLDYLKKKSNKAEIPINFVIEEAHRFIKNENNYGPLGYNIFERISKEGRKYGLLLGISSQRPSELSKTVVSQCSNFIIHRVQNPDDLQYISRMVPYINQGIIERLTYLQTGHALVFGTAINLPTLTSFEQAKPCTDSHNAKISEKWYVN